MSKPTYTQAELTLRQANIRTSKAIIGILFWVAVGAVPAWHFATEHERLVNYEKHSNDPSSKQVAMNVIPNLENPEQSKAFVTATGSIKGSK